jgi:hypothetical protein
LCVCVFDQILNYFIYVCPFSSLYKHMWQGALMSSKNWFLLFVSLSFSLLLLFCCTYSFVQFIYSSRMFYIPRERDL